MGTHTTVGENVTIGRDAKVGTECVISRETRIGAAAKVADYVRMPVGTTVPADSEANVRDFPGSGQWPGEEFDPSRRAPTPAQAQGPSQSGKDVQTPAPSSMLAAAQRSRGSAAGMTDGGRTPRVRGANRPVGGGSPVDAGGAKRSGQAR